MEMRSLRTLLILIRRQTADDAVYFVISLVLSLLSILSLVSIALSEELKGLSLYAIALGLALPVVIGTGSCLLGIMQTRADDGHGISGLLLILPPTYRQVLAARMIVGIAVILIALAPLAVAGAILWEVLIPNDSSVSNCVPAMLISAFLIGLAGYCLGVRPWQDRTAPWVALRRLPLALIAPLLIICKGFGPPLMAILLLFVFCLTMGLRRPSRRSLSAAICTGLAVLVWLSVPLFWARFLRDVHLAASVPGEVRSIRFASSGLLPSGIEKERGARDASSASAELNLYHADALLVNSVLGPGHPLQAFSYRFTYGRHLLKFLGIVDYFQPKCLDRTRAYHRYASPSRYFRLTTTNGRIVLWQTSKRGGGRTLWEQGSCLFAGPAGVSQTNSPDLGQFLSPVVGSFDPLEEDTPRDTWRERRAPVLLYDRGQGCIFAIDFANRTVRKGAAWKDPESPPVDIGPMERWGLCRIDYGPSRERSDLPGSLVESRLVPVICASGQVDLLDPNTLEVVGSAGALPRPASFIGFGSCKPRDLLAYNVRLVDVLATKEELARGEPSRRYAGMIAATVSRQGTSMAVEVFDRDGRTVRSACRGTFPYAQYATRPRSDTPRVALAKDVLSGVTRHPVDTGPKYLLESLHPPVLTLASFFTAYSFDAGATHRALFLMPNSFVALQRDGQASLPLNTLWALLVMIPAMLLSSLMAWRVTRDAAIIGLSRRERRLWLVGTFLFGLPAYVTYRLMRPKCVLTLCGECGRGRRVDRDVCHHCGSGWDTPSLESPAWRVIGAVGKERAASAQAE